MNDHMLLLATNAEMVEFALEIAKSEPDMPWQDAAAWIAKNCIQPSITEAKLRAKLKGRPPQIVAQRVRHVMGILDDLSKLRARSQ